ncbi:MAG: WYL domain-containing protein, partial [Clostridia bacterium]|nr:WYL domain-containing protein [Clostridia bacterium]
SATALPYMYTDKPENIKLKCKMAVIDDIVDWFGTDSTINKLDDDYVIATVTASPTAMQYWAMQYGNFVEVLAPATLRAKVAESALELAKKYQ